MTYPKRLIEVDLPIKEISAHARREKSIRHGHISTLHIWWARRPLAACRAVLCAALWPDPADELCPKVFRAQVAKIVAEFAEHVRTIPKIKELCRNHWTRWNRTNASTVKPENPGCWGEMRYALLDFIADFANWDASTVPEFLETARALTQAAHEALGGIPGTRPLVVDPFAGGGSIPLEALRVGADAFASDLNPVAVLLNKVVLEYIPKYGNYEFTMPDEHGNDITFHGLAEAVRYWGNWIKAQAEKELAEFYPKDEDGATPIAYLWARTITCEGPNCGAEVPLMRSLWLAKKVKKSVALRIKTSPPTPLQQERGDSPPLRGGAGGGVSFEIFTPAVAKDVAEGTVKRGAATCPCCGYTTPVTSVRKQLKARRGGAHDARLFAVVTTKPGQQGRFYRLPTARDLEAVRKAAAELERRKAEYTGVLSLVPDEPLPPQGALGFRVQLYGMEKWGELFSPRQALSLTTLTRLVQKVGENLNNETDSSFVVAVQTLLAFALDKQADLGNALNRWEPVAQCPRQLFARQAIPIVWDFAEGIPLGSSSGAFEVFINASVKALGTIGSDWGIGQIDLSDATTHPLPNDISQCLFTDPPYYDAVPYSDLSDFFITWLKRSIGDKYRVLLDRELAPKEEECIVDEVKGKDRVFFEKKMSNAMAEGRRILTPNGVGVVVFAHKSTSGWEAQLQAMIDAGWMMTGSWPIDTENTSRLRAHDSSALASSIHLVCRPREDPDGTLRDDIGDWREVLSALPKRIHAWMPRLAQEGIVGADAIFACLGPALEIFSRYARVEKASGEAVTLGEYLEQVWAAVSKEALELIFAGVDTSDFEPDARLTAMWLWTLSTNEQLAMKNEELEEEEGADAEQIRKTAVKSAGYGLEYDTARKIAQGLGAMLEQLPQTVEIKGNQARLLPVVERRKYLFGKETGQRAPQARSRSAQQTLFASDIVDAGVTEIGTTVLDQVHQSMLLFADGRGDALRRFLVEDGVGRNARFWRLADCLSKLYPLHTDEKRWVDGVLARKKGLGL